MQTTRTSAFTGKISIVTLALFGLFTISISTHAQSKQLPSATQTSNPFSTDTIKFRSGVPLTAQDISPLLVGERIPKLSLVSSVGQTYDLNASIGTKPTILVFYRGGWCPYCSLQLSGLQKIEKDLIQMGYQIIAISTDSPENLNKTLGKEKLSYMLLSDADLKASKSFGIAFKGPKNYDGFLTETSGGKNTNKLLPVPSVFIIDKKGTILFEYINPNITQRISGPLLKAAAQVLRDEMKM